MDPILLQVLIIFAVLMFLLFSGTPIFFALGFAAVFLIAIDFGPHMLLSLAYVGWSSSTSFLMGSIPMFVLMGYMLFETGLSRRVYDGVAPLLGRLLPGGILHTNIVVGAAFAACSGSSVACAATIGAVALPEMERRGYERGIAVGSVAAGGTLGILIPPSITLIIYGFMADESIGRLYFGGVIPGLILAASYMAYIAIRLKINPKLARESTGPKPSWGFCFRELGKVWIIPALFAGVMGSIYSGLATATEAAAVGCAMVFVMALGYRLLTWDNLKRTLRSTVTTSSMVLMLCFSGSLLGAYLGNSGVVKDVTVVVLKLGWSPLAIYICIQILYFVLGCLMDGISMMILTIPIVVPIMKGLGFDMIWFGVVMTMLVELGLLTPPVGAILFILQGLRPEYTFKKIVSGCTPFFIVIIIVIQLVSIFPHLVTFLPKLMMK
jgi:tripartite ATP-independent transporter DctM subunit